METKGKLNLYYLELPGPTWTCLELPENFLETPLLLKVLFFKYTQAYPEQDPGKNQPRANRQCGRLTCDKVIHGAHLVKDRKRTAGPKQAGKGQEQAADACHDACKDRFLH